MPKQQGANPHTTIFILGLLSRICLTRVVKEAMMSVVALLCWTISLVPRCIVITSAGFFCSQPTSCFWFAMLMARNPEWPSLSRSYLESLQLFSFRPDPTKSTEAHSVVCSLFHSLDRQQVISV